MNKSRYKWRSPSLGTPYLTTSRETIIYTEHNKIQSTAFGVGIVIKVEQGKDMDIVYMNVGKGYGLKFCKKLYVVSSLARRQLYTLVINQYAMFYGFKTNKSKIINVACFFPSFVPKLSDRREILEDNDGDLGFSELNAEKEQDILSQFERK